MFYINEVDCFEDLKLEYQMFPMKSFTYHAGNLHLGDTFVKFSINVYGYKIE